MKNQDSIITQADVKKSYHFYAPIYDLLFGAILEPGRRALCKRVAKLKPQRLLEIGVGTGLLLSKYPIDSQITGIDISEDMLKIAKQTAEKLIHMNINLALVDAEHLNFPDNSFDCVVVPYVLSVTPDPETLISEARRVCCKNGTIMILNHFSGSGFWHLLEKAFENLANKIGFRSEFSYQTHILKYNWNITEVKDVNLLGLSKLIIIKND